MSFVANSRMVIFDACYNGDFREKDYIAGRYIMSEGKCVTTFANSVNVLQDKMANEMLGLLGMGADVYKRQLQTVRYLVTLQVSISMMPMVIKLLILDRKT